MDVESHKRSHKPVVHLTESGEVKGAHQGYYVPQHPDKIIGSPAELIYRSGWERDLCRWCDDNPNVRKWGIEVAKIEYRDPGNLDFDELRRLQLNPADPSIWPVRSYFIDFYIEFDRSDDDGDEDSDGASRKLLVEVKPKAQTIRPVPPQSTAKLKEQKRFVLDCRTYLTNEAKWKAAKAWADSHGMKFVVWTEDTLTKLGIM